MFHMLFRSRLLWQAMGIAPSTVPLPWWMEDAGGKEQMAEAQVDVVGAERLWGAGVGTALPSGTGMAASRSPSCSLLCTGRAFFSSFPV